CVTGSATTPPTAGRPACPASDAALGARRGRRGGAWVFRVRRRKGAPDPSWAWKSPSSLTRSCAMLPARWRPNSHSGVPNSTTAGEMIPLLSTDLQRPACHHLTNADPRLHRGQWASTASGVGPRDRESESQGDWNADPPPRGTLWIKPTLDRRSYP